MLGCVATYDRVLVDLVIITRINTYRVEIVFFTLRTFPDSEKT